MKMRLSSLLSAFLIAFGIFAGGVFGHVEATPSVEAGPTDDWEWD